MKEVQGLPPGWLNIDDEQPGVLLKVLKIYRDSGIDGPDVVLFARKSERGIEVWVSPYHPFTDVPDTLCGCVATVDEAERLIVQEARGWDEALLSR